MYLLIMFISTKATISFYRKLFTLNSHCMFTRNHFVYLCTDNTIFCHHFYSLHCVHVYVLFVLFLFCMVLLIKEFELRRPPILSKTKKTVFHFVETDSRKVRGNIGCNYKLHNFFNTFFFAADNCNGTYIIFILTNFKGCLKLIITNKIDLKIFNYWISFPSHC